HRQPRVRLALLRVLSLHRGDAPTHRHEISGSERGDVPDLHVGLSCHGILDLEQWVIGHELSEHLLLEAQQRALVELGTSYDGLVDLARGPLAAAEERELAERLGFALGGDRRRDLLLMLVQTPPRVAERVERAGEDEAPDDLLREDPRIDLAA